MFSKRLKFKLILVQGWLMLVGLVGALALSSIVPRPLPSWYLAAIVVLLGLTLSIASYVVIARLLRRLTMAISDIEAAMRTSAVTMDMPAFSVTARRSLPHVTEALDRTVDRLRSAYQGMAGVARKDAVTGLANRLHFAETVTSHFSGGASDAALLFIDLDQFKSVNDSLGHSAGDEVLRCFGKRVGQTLAGSEEHADSLLARIAGDEFAIFLPGVSDIDTARRTAGAILDCLDDPFHIGNDHRLGIGASIGIALSGPDCRTLDCLLQHADAAMYEAKEAGRNTFRVYADEMREEAKSRLELEARLRGAAGRDEFELFLQPLVSPYGREVLSAEALLRWNDPERGMILPGGFIELAEDRGLIGEIGNWVLGETCRLAGLLQAERQPLRLGLNISMRQLETPGLADRVERAFARAGADPNLLEVEIAESLLMRASAGAVRTLEQLRELGLSVAVDDFGMAYSNLQRLRDLPIDRVKIDRSLVKDIANSDSACAILQAVLRLIEGMGYDCAVEGIENDEQAQIVSVIGCEAMQGFGIARPMPADAFLAWARERRSDGAAECEGQPLPRQIAFSQGQDRGVAPRPV